MQYLIFITRLLPEFMDFALWDWLSTRLAVRQLDARMNGDFSALLLSLYVASFVASQGFELG